MERLRHRRGVNWRARSLAVHPELLGGRVGKGMVAESAVRHCKQLKAYYEIRSLDSLKQIKPNQQT